jgi:nucleotide-binding universal stress UspA family protein
MARGPVVVGTDGSGHALLALEWAAREAAERGESLQVVSVPFAWPVSTPAQILTFAVSSDVGDADEAAARIAVAAAADRAAELFPGLRVDVGILPGSPVQTLLGCAAAASMIVVGSRGAGGFAAMVLGSVSRCIATSAPCAAVVVRGGTVPARGVVAVGVREPGNAAAALQFGFEEARLRRSRLLVVHAWGSHGLRADGPPGGVDPGGAEPMAAGKLRDVLADWAVQYPGVDIEADVVRDHPGRALSAASARADLVVLGRHHRRDSGGPALGSALHAVLDHAPGPVAIIPDR